MSHLVRPHAKDSGPSPKFLTHALSPTFPSHLQPKHWLNLQVLPKLERICPQALTFPKLIEIHVDKCESLRKLPLNARSASGSRLNLESSNPSSFLDQNSRPKPSSSSLHYLYFFFSFSFFILPMARNPSPYCRLFVGLGIRLI